MPDLEKPDSQNNNAQKDTHQEQKILELPEHASQKDTNSVPEQQISEGTKRNPYCEIHFHKNETFKEPNVHEKNYLLNDLKNKLDNIDALIKKARQNHDTVSKETTQEMLTQSSPQQLLEEKSKEEVMPLENKEISKTSPKPDEQQNTQTIPQQLLEEKTKDETKQAENKESATNNVIPDKTQEKQENAIEQVTLPQTESKPEEIKQPPSQKLEPSMPTTQEMPQTVPQATPKDYSKITTFGEADEAIKADPENYKHYVARAELYVKKQDYKNAEADYKKAQELTQSKDIFVLAGLAKIYDLSGQPAVAVTIYSQALELSPSNIEILNSRAHCYETLGQEENFFKDIEKAIEIDPNNAKNYISRAEHYMAKNNFQKSLEDVNKIIALKPENSSARYFRGILYYNLQNYQDCFNDMQKTLELKTDQNEVYKYLGICGYKTNHFSDAINFLKKAIELDLTMVKLTITKPMQNLNQEILIPLCKIQINL